jgi:hypothetical protein
LKHHQNLAVDGIKAAVVGFVKLNGGVGHENKVP